MPIYEYECSRCRHHFDLKQSFFDEPIGACPACGGEGRRVMQAAAIIFKGSGFHSTDYRKSGATVAPSHKKDESDSAAASATTTASPPSKEADS